MTSVVVDEDLDVRLRRHFGPGVRAETVEYRGWKHLKNGVPRGKLLKHLLELMPEVLGLLPTLRPGAVVEVHPPPPTQRPE